jgi:hypothetical protein
VTLRIEPPKPPPGDSTISTAAAMREPASTLHPRISRARVSQIGIGQLDTRPDVRMSKIGTDRAFYV